MQGVGRLDVPARPLADAIAAPRALLRVHWPVLVAAAVTILAGIPTLAYPYGPDQALFAYIGERLLGGAGLYTDVWDVKPPGVFLIYAAIDLIPGPPFRVLRVVDLAWTVATVTAIYALGAGWWGRLAGAVAGALYGVVYIVGTGYWHSAQPDSFMVLPLVLGVLAYERARHRRNLRLALLSGLLFGVCAQLRPVILLVPAVVVAFDVLGASAPSGVPGASSRMAAVRRTVALAVGGVAVTALVLLWLALHGAVGEYLYAQLDFASNYARQGGPYSPDGLNLRNYLSGLRTGTMFIAFARTLLFAPALVAVIAGSLVRRDRAVWLTAALALAAFAGVAIQGKYFLYHWHSLLPFLALLSGWTAAFLWRSLRDTGRSPVAAGATLAVLGVALLLLTPNVSDRAVREWKAFAGYVTESGDRSTYYDRFGLYGRSTFSYRASEETAGYLRAQTKPGDTIFIWGYDPLLFITTGMDSPSRFLTFLPLMSDWTPPAWHREFVADIQRERPAYIVVQGNENAPWITGNFIDPPDFIKLLPDFERLLSTDYEFDRRIEDYRLYRRR